MTIVSFINLKVDTIPDKKLSKSIGIGVANAFRNS